MPNSPTQTILLTGAAGFLGKHIALLALQQGHRVRAGMRNPAREAEMRAALAPHLDAEALARLSVVGLDLEQDAGWRAAMDGVDTLIHTASPFPIAQPKEADTLIRPAVQGTLRALRAARAAGVPRVVLTSSTAAVLNRGGRPVQDETDWMDPDQPGATPYVRSKVMAERAAWDYVRDEAKGLALTVINPGFILGPPLDGHYGSSVKVVARILSGRDPAAPALGLPVVDVRDVARMHLIAATDLHTAGKRYIASAGSMWMVDMAQVLATAYPDRKIGTRLAPTWLMRLLSLFDPQIRGILPELGHMGTVSNARARKEMGMAFITPQDALLATAAFLTTQA